MKRIIIFSVLLLSGFFSRAQDADSLLQQYKTYPDDTIKINLLYDKGYEFRNTDLPAAIKFARACYLTALKVDNAHYLARALNFSAVLKSETGQQEEALADFKKALQLRIQTRDTLSQAILLNNLGNVYRSLGNTEQSMLCYERSLDAARCVGSDRWILGALTSISELQTELKKFRQAEGNLYTLINWAQTDNDQEILGICYKNMSDCKLGLGDTLGAEAYLVLAMDAAEMTEDAIQKADVLLAIAKIELLQKKTGESVKHMNQALSIYTRNNYSEGLLKGWKQWSEILNEKGEHKQAYVYLAKYDSAMASVRSKDNSSFTELWKMNAEEEARIKKKNTSLGNTLFESAVVLALLCMLLIVALKKPHEQKEQKG